MKTKEAVCKRIILSIFFLLVLCRTAGAQDSQKATLTAADAGTCSATSTACLVINIPSGSGGATFNIGANASANTIQFEASADYGTTWVALSVTPSSSTTTVTSTTSTGAWQANVAGYTKARMRISTLVGGNTTAYINLSTASARSNGGGGSVTHTAGNLTAFHLMLGNGLADSTVDSACLTNGTGALSGCTSISAGSGASSAGATATGGFATIEAASTGWTPTAGQDYIRADTTHAWFCGMNGVAEPGCTFGALTAATFTSNGTTAGFIDFPQGADSGVIAPCNAATSICWEAPTSVTSYKGILPGAAATGIPHYTNAANVITETIGLITASDCTVCVVNNGTNTGTTAMTLDMSASTTASALKIPVGAGLTSAANGAIAYDTTAGATHVRSNGADSLAAAEAAAIVANTVAKATNSTNSLITASSMIDNGTSVTSTDTGGYVAPVFVSNGTTAGFVDYPQGTTSAAVAPCNAATSICEQAPTAVTSYLLNKLAGPSSGIKLESNSASVLTETSSGDANHSVHVTAQTATKTIYTLCPASAGGCNVAGQYRVTWYFNQGGTACGTPTPGQVTFALSWTDNAGAHSAIALPMNDNSSIAVFTSAFKFAATNVTGFASGEFNLWSTGAQPIQVTNTYTACGVGTGTWELTAAVEQVQ